MTVKVYVEGGGNTRELRARCREGFSSFFGKEGLVGRMPKIVACGGRKGAYMKFRTAMASGNEREFIVLLVDSEGPRQGALRTLASPEEPRRLAETR